MGATVIVTVVIVSPIVFCVVCLSCASEEWLRAFVILARSLGRSI
jgi:hypothetical protein